MAETQAEPAVAEAQAVVAAAAEARRVLAAYWVETEAVAADTAAEALSGKWATSHLVEVRRTPPWAPVPVLARE